MRMLGKNKQKIKYALFVREEEIQIKSGTTWIKTGEFKQIYSTPVEFLANISFGGGDAKAVEFGVDLSDYDATVICHKGLVPLTETSLIWHTSEPRYDGNVLNPRSADYKVVRCIHELNDDYYILQRLVK